VRCDIPANVYQTSFSPNTQWSEEYAQGPEILAYWKGIAAKYGVYDKIQFNSRILKTAWEPQKSQWRLENETVVDGRKTTEYYDFVILAIGHFNEWKLPDYPGTRQNATCCHDVFSLTMSLHRYRPIQRTYPSLVQLGSRVRSKWQADCDYWKRCFWNTSYT
jgi:hypothetical protein